MADESMWIERAQNAEARAGAYSEQIERMKEDVRYVLDAFGARKRSDGSFDIDYEKFVEALGPEGALEVRRLIDAHYSISGAPGEKPRIKAKARAA